MGPRGWVARRRCLGTVLNLSGVIFGKTGGKNFRGQKNRGEKKTGKHVFEGRNGSGGLGGSKK